MSKKKYLIFFLTALFLVPGFFAFGPLVIEAQNLTPSQEAQLRAELAQVEAEQKAAQADLENQQAKSSSIARDIAILDAKIKVAQLNIKAKNLQIETLGKDITKKVAYIGVLDERISKGIDSLATIMRKTNEVDSYSIAELMLSQNTLTGFFQNIDDFASVQEGLKTTFEQIRSDKSETESEKTALEKRKNAELDAKHTIELEKKNVEGDEKEKQKLLAISKDTEQSYATVLAQKKARAATIRAALFPLRDSSPIPFGDALAYATKASKVTGVRPAFVLAILTQESSLGQNVGKCYLTDTNTGAGIGAKTGTAIANVMKPGRDVGPFLEITKALGIDYTRQVVSCPQSVGYGGAMGPAQFIASTWMLFKNRLVSALGINGMPDPWNAETAFMASSIYLGDLGASAQTYSSERNAACKYYSGSVCSKSSLVATYGNSVVAKADNIQRTMIDPLQGI